MEQSLKGKTALVTGGSRGIGAATAVRLAAAGADVAVTYLHSEASAARVATECRELGVKAEIFRADAASFGDMNTIVDRVWEQFGALDILINNAALFFATPLNQVTDEQLEQALNANIRSVFLTTRAAARVMGNGGRIVNLGSILGERAGRPNLSLYAMSKAAVAGLTRAAARELGGRGITVNCVHPGPTDTDMNPADGERSAGQKAQSALGRYGSPQELAETIAFLASPAAAYVTGACLTVDGGYNA